MVRSVIIAAFLGVFALPIVAYAGDAETKAQRLQDVREYIKAITEYADQNLHSCAADKWEKDEDLNAASGITDEELQSLLNPPQS